MKSGFTRAPAFTKAIIASAVFMCLVASVLPLALKHKDSTPGLRAPVQQARHGPLAQASAAGTHYGKAANSVR